MSGISPSLPLRLDPQYPGFALNITMLDVVKQNFKHLVLTVPGERIMITDFGVGIRNFLFEPNNPATHALISSRIYSQVKKYMPFIVVRNIDITNSGEGTGDLGHGAQITITYEVITIGAIDALLIEI
tara:strand:+ start:173 stop:556 length:384 start_codon:yes stop_codon:yes gene_type:complete